MTEPLLEGLLRERQLLRDGDGYAPLVAVTGAGGSAADGGGRFVLRNETGMPLEFWRADGQGSARCDDGFCCARPSARPRVVASASAACFDFWADVGGGSPTPDGAAAWGGGEGGVVPASDLLRDCSVAVSCGGLEPVCTRVDLAGETCHTVRSTSGAPLRVVVEVGHEGTATIVTVGSPISLRNQSGARPPLATAAGWRTRVVHTPPFSTAPLRPRATQAYRSSSSSTPRGWRPSRRRLLSPARRCGCRWPSQPT